MRKDEEIVKFVNPQRPRTHDSFSKSTVSSDQRCFQIRLHSSAQSLSNSVGLEILASVSGRNKTLGNWGIIAC